MARTQKNKVGPDSDSLASRDCQACRNSADVFSVPTLPDPQATEYHLGLLKAKLARYRAELLEGSSGGSSKAGAGFDVAKAGFGRAVLIGFPSGGQATLLSKVSSTESAAAAYAFTTLVAVPGGPFLVLPRGFI